MKLSNPPRWAWTLVVAYAVCVVAVVAEAGTKKKRRVWQSSDVSYPIYTPCLPAISNVDATYFPHGGTDSVNPYVKTTYTRKCLAGMSNGCPVVARQSMFYIANGVIEWLDTECQEVFTGCGGTNSDRLMYYLGADPVPGHYFYTVMFYVGQSCDNYNQTSFAKYTDDFVVE